MNPSGIDAGQVPAPEISPESTAARGMTAPDSTTGSIVPPIHLSSTFARDARYDARNPYTYARDGGPTAREAEDILRALEQAEATLLFTSGMSALAAVLEALPMGAHVVIPDRMYHGGLAWSRRLARLGRIRADCFHPGGPGCYLDALRPGETRLLWIETPSNPECWITDIEAASHAAKTAGALLLVDSTTAPPPTTRALNLGANIVFHSGTKYLNGHSDVTAGVLSFREAGEIREEIECVRKFHGTALPGFEAWLLMRGLRTLFVRFARISESAMAIATALERHPQVDRVLYAGLPSHPGHGIAARQMTGGFGGMMSIVTRGDAAQARNVARRCRLFVPATSLGGTESLIEHRKSIEGEDSPVPDGLLRLSVGLETAAELIEDLNRALSLATEE